jgi:hypothetical protein
MIARRTRPHRLRGSGPAVVIIVVVSLGLTAILGPEASATSFVSPDDSTAADHGVASELQEVLMETSQGHLTRTEITFVEQNVVLPLSGELIQSEEAGLDTFRMMERAPALYTGESHANEAASPEVQDDERNAFEVPSIRNETRFFEDNWHFDTGAAMFEPRTGDGSEQTNSLLADGLEGSAGSAIGPGRALFVAEGAAGRISRVDPDSGELTTFASGLPQMIPEIGFGGPVDVAFYGSTAYALVTLVGPDVGGDATVGIYRIDGPEESTLIADLGTWSADNPSEIEFPVDVPSGVQYAIEPFRGGFLVSDGHHNRVLKVSRDGEISEFVIFDDIVPTGLEVSGNVVYVALAGPVPHVPEDGEIVAVNARTGTVSDVASGAPLAVDVQSGRGQTLFALAQGEFPEDGIDGQPALPDTGELLEIDSDGSMTTIVEGLDRPTSMQFIGNTAYVVTLTGEVWMIENVSAPPFGMRR